MPIPTIRPILKCHGIYYSSKTVSNWENDNIQPSIEMLVRLSKLFGVTTDYLLGLEETPRLSVEGLPAKVVAHLSELIADFTQTCQEP